MRFSEPRCPKCGELARFRHGLFIVKLGITFNGEDANYTGQRRIGYHHGPPFKTLECWSGHTWDSWVWVRDDEGEVDE